MHVIYQPDFIAPPVRPPLLSTPLFPPCCLPADQVVRPPGSRADGEATAWAAEESARAWTWTLPDGDGNRAGASIMQMRSGSMCSESIRLGLKIAFRGFEGQNHPKVQYTTISKVLLWASLQLGLLTWPEMSPGLPEDVGRSHKRMISTLRNCLREL